MNHASLAARYRPQTFAEVTGQDTVKAILSRAAAEDRVAPAYLLSGTRGVGKTTIARIFAKALNCEHAPTGEPCNQCEQCRRIMQGNHVDVVEIDGASNRGIDDARRLREAIAYAPMEGRYKVFIIDEAHMLTRESFNALLKTLEEPPPRATFILATTEAHKFPVTIVSRCQHFIFKAIPESGLVAHLTRVLQREGLPFEEAAVRLLARRAAGSVRDSMSLLGQTLALGGESLTEASTRTVLGVAGQELYERLLRAFLAQDCIAVASLTQELLEAGVDLGFFLRELAQLWRNLFLIRQAGEAAIPLLDMPEAERQRLLDIAPEADLAYIHAAWQMVLEGQRQVLASLEPSAALELLLLQLALLPRLVSLETLSGAAPSAPSVPAMPVPSGVTSGAGGVCPSMAPTSAPRPCTPRSAQPVPYQVEQRPQPVPRPQPVSAADVGRGGSVSAVPPVSSVQSVSATGQPATRSRAEQGRDAATPHDPPPWDEDPAPVSGASGNPASPRGDSASAHDVAGDSEAQRPFSEAACSTAVEGAPLQEAVAGERLAVSDDAPSLSADTALGRLDWRRFVCACLEDASCDLPAHLLEQVQGIVSETGLRLVTTSSFQYEQWSVQGREATLRRLLSAYCGEAVPVVIEEPACPRKTEVELKKDFAEHPVIKHLTETFGGSLLRCIAVEPPRNT